MEKRVAAVAPQNLSEEEDDLINTSLDTLIARSAPANGPRAPSALEEDLEMLRVIEADMKTNKPGVNWQQHELAYLGMKRQMFTAEEILAAQQQQHEEAKKPVDDTV